MNREKLEWLEPVDVGETAGLSVPGDRFRVDGVEFQCLLGPAQSTPEKFFIRKSRALAEEYLEVLDHFQDARIVELGIAEGGSFALASIFNDPAKLVGVEIAAERVSALDQLIARRGLGDRARPYYGIDQADGTRLREIVAAEFDDEPLDLVIDDASHRLAETRSSFETLFPLLRPGGLFLIEDWNHQHLLSLALANALSGPDPDPELEANFRRGLASGPPEAPLSRLAIEFVLAQAESQDYISRVSVGHHFLGVRRGHGSLDAGEFRLSDLYTDHVGLLPG